MNSHPFRAQARQPLVSHFAILTALLLLLIIAAGLGGVPHAQATPPITPSGLNTQVTLSQTPPAGKTQYDITGGTRPGGGTNLFHSFGDFNVPNNNIANFLNDSGLATSNILGRVTGGNISNIFGTIQTTGFGNANLFLMNPAGFLFGPTATVNVGGMVAFTTADYLRLADGVRFNAVPDVVADALLSAAPVAAFGFLGSNPGAITVQGSQLSVADGTGISLVGGNITIQSGTLDNGTVQSALLSAPGGQINIVSVASAGEAILATARSAPAFDVSSFPKLGQITISGNSTLDASDVSGTGGGSVFIRAGQFTLDGSTINVNTLGDVNGAPVAVDLQVTNDILLTNGSSINVGTLGAGPLYGPQGAGRTGDVIITASTMEIDHSAFIQTYTLDNGRAGDVRVNVGTLTLSDGSQLDSGNFGSGSGQGGNLIVQGQLGAGSMAESVSISGVDHFGFQSGLFSETFASGNAGNISVSAKSVTMDDGGILYTSTGGTGSAGNITLNVGTLMTNMVDPGAALVTIQSDSYGNNTPADGKAGNITINASGPIILNSTNIETNAYNTGQGGSISLTSASGPTSQIVLNRTSLLSTVTDLPPGASAGTPAQIAVTADTVSITGAFPLTGGIATNTAGSAPAGNILLNVNTLRSNVNPDGTPTGRPDEGTAGIGSSSSSPLSTAGPAGTVTIKGPDPNNPTDAAKLVALDHTGIVSSVLGGTAETPAGTITISADTVILTHMGITTVPATGPNANSVIPIGAGIAAETAGPAPAGNIIFNVKTLLSNVNPDGTPIPGTAAGLRPLSQATTQAEHLPSGSFADQTFISSRSDGESFPNPQNPMAGRAGSVIIKGPDPTNPNDAATLVALNNTQILTTVPGGTSNTSPGQISITANTLALTNGTQILADTSGGAPAGNITFNVGTLSSNIQVHGSGKPMLDPSGNPVPLHAPAPVSITSTSTGTGRAGTITIRGVDSTDAVNTPAALVALNNTTVSTVVSNAVSSSANPAQITITANTVNLSNGTQITADTSGAAPAGDITVTATDTLSLAGGSSLLASTHGSGNAGQVLITTPTLTMDNGHIRTDTEGEGAGGNINIFTQSFTLQNGGTLSAATSGTAPSATGGTVTVEGNTVQLNSAATITTATSGPAANAGDILVKADTFSMSGGAMITAQSTGSGNAGNVTIQGLASPAQSVLIDGAGSGIFTDTQGTGAGGNIFVNANAVTLQNGGTLSAATSGTDPSASGGTITVNAGQFNLTNGGMMTASTTGAGAGGSINIGTGTFASNASTVSSTASQATGGDINIGASQSVTLNNGSSITASSTGAGNAGNVMINAGQSFLATNSSVTTQASQASGGTIKISTTPSGTVELINSTISASVLHGTGGGGSVNIDPQFVLLQNSQILANAVQGPGGNISITTNLLLPDANSVISASSQFGVNGTVTVQSPNAPATGKIIPLSQKPLTATALLSQRCAALASGEFSSFTVAGRDSLPAEPGGWLASPLALAISESGSGTLTEARERANVDEPDEKTPLLSLRQIAPPGFLTQAFAVDWSAGCTS